MSTRIRLFGPLEVEDGEGVVVHSVLAHSKAAAVLVLLTLRHRALQRRDWLTAILWPDLDDDRARNALSKALHHLRRALSHDAFVSSGDDLIGLNVDRVWSDVAAFEAAIGVGQHEEALRLFRRGELLDGFRLNDVSEFERWVEPERVRLRQRAMECALSLAGRSERTGDFATAATWAAVACEITPHNEPALRRRMTLLARAGDRAGALRAFQDFESLIRRDLEVEPSDETHALAESFRNGNGRDAAPSPPDRPPEPRAHLPVAEPMVVEETSLPTPVRSYGRLTYGMAAAVTCAALILGYRAFRSAPRGVVAIGPVVNQTGDTAFNDLARRSAGRIAAEVVQSGRRFVVDLPSVDSGARVIDMARIAGAQTLVAGSLYRSHDSVVAQVQLVDPRTGRLVQNLDPIGAPVANAYGLIDRLNEAVNGALSALADTLYLPWSRAHSRTPTYSAFQEFMQGLDATMHQGGRPAVEHFRRAIALDSEFVEAKLWLIEQGVDFPEYKNLVDSVAKAARAQRSRLGEFDRASLDRELAFIEERPEDTYTAARRMAALAPDVPDAQLMLAQAAMATRRFGEAIAALHQAATMKGWISRIAVIRGWDLQAHRLNGDLATALEEWRIGRVQSPTEYGVCSEGVLILSELGRAVEVDSLIAQCARLPTAPSALDREYFRAGRGFRRGGHAAMATTAFEKSLALQAARMRTPRQLRIAVGMMDCELERWHEAVDSLRGAIDTTSFDQQIALGVAGAHIGDSTLVNAALRWLDRESVRPGERLTGRAYILAAKGDHDEAISLLERAEREAGVVPPWQAWYVRYELQPLRADPRFQDLIRPRE